MFGTHFVASDRSDCGKLCHALGSTQVVLTKARGRPQLFYCRVCVAVPNLGSWLC